MSDAGRTSTTLDIKVNARDLQRLDRTLKETFSDRTPRAMTKSLEVMNRTMTSLTRAASQLTAELGRQRQGSDVYKEMRADLEAVRKEATQLRQELDRLRSGGGPGGVGGAAGGFAAGGGWRWPWSRSGGGGGGGGGATTGGGPGVPQAPMPTAGAVAQGLSGIPVVGAALGGGVLASYSMFGSALRYEQAKRDTWAFVRHGGVSTPGTPGTLTYTGGSMAGMPVGDPDLDNLVGFMRGGVPSRPMTSEKIDQHYRDPRVHYGPDWNAGPGGLMDRGTRTRPMTDAEMVASGAAKYVGGTPAVSYLDQYQSAAQRWGHNPAEGLQLASQLSRAAGHRASGSEFEGALSAQYLYGIGLEQTGGMLHAGRRTGAGGMDIVARSIGTAVATGLEGSEIGEYLSQIQHVLQQQLELGGQTSTLAIDAMTRRLAGANDSGIGGFMAGRVATGVATGISGIARRGAGGADEFEILRAAGWTGGTEDYFAKLNALQNPDEAVKLLPALIERFRGVGGAGSETEANAMQRMLRFVGADVDIGVARKLASGMDWESATGSRMTAASLRGEGAAAAPGMAGLLAKEAGMEADRIGVGYKAADQVQWLNQKLIDLSGAIQDHLGPAIETLMGTIDSAAAWFGSVTPPTSPRP